MFRLPSLPYPDNGLEPVVSSHSLRLHHGVLHRRYVEACNAAVREERLRVANVLDLVGHAVQTGSDHLYDQAAQTFNHALLWRSMAPPGNGGGSRPFGKVGTLMRARYGAPERITGRMVAFEREWAEAGLSVFGSGWVWLCADPARTRVWVTATRNADLPVGLLEGTLVPLAVCDVWEHAYYLDDGPQRRDWLLDFTRFLIDWSAAERRLLDPSTVRNTQPWSPHQ